MEFDFFAWYALSTVGVLVLLATAYVAYAHPRAAVPVGFFLVLLADTKFRVRDATAASMDGQILLELGVYGLLATIAVMLFANSRRRRSALGVLDFLLGGYVLVCMASAGWSLAPTFTVVRSFQLVVLFVLAHASARVVGSERTMRALTASCTLYVLSCVALVLVLPQFAGQSSGRFAWFAVHPISAGSYTAIAALCILAVGIYSVKGWRDRILWCPVWLYPLPLVTVLLMTNSRGPLLAFIGGTCFLLLKRLRPHVATVVVSVGVLVMLTVVGLASSASSYLAESSKADDNILVRRLLRGQTADQLLGLSGRAELWKNSMGAFYQRPVIGYGYQGSRSVLLSAESWAGHAHSGYMQTLLDVGVIGAALIFSAFVLVTISRFPGRRRRIGSWDEYAVSAAMVFLLLNSITHESFAVAGYELLVACACITVTARQRLVESRVALPRRSAGVAAQPTASHTPVRTVTIPMDRA